MVSWVYANVKTYQTAHKYVQFIECQLFLNKDISPLMEQKSKWHQIQFSRIGQNFKSSQRKNYLWSRSLCSAKLALESEDGTKHVQIYKKKAV